MDKLKEEYYRVPFEVAKLLKEAGFMETCEMYWYDNVPIKATCSNKGIPSNRAAAPLIAIAKTWCEEKGYKHHALTAYSTNTDWSKNFVCNYTDNREVDIAFISTVCNHLIKTQQ
jgi:hypothetical protein